MVGNQAAGAGNSCYYSVPCAGHALSTLTCHLLSSPRSREVWLLSPEIKTLRLEWLINLSRVSQLISGKPGSRTQSWVAS